MAAQPAERHIVVGRIAAAHGIRGWLKVVSYTEPPEALLGYRGWRLRHADGAEMDCQPRDAEWDGRFLRVALHGVDDRNAAEGLRGCEVLVRRAELPRPGAREHYQEDLLGCEVRNQAGVLLGTLQQFVDAPTAAVMVVRGEREYWIPAAPPHLRRVELEQRRVLVDWPEDF